MARRSTPLRSRGKRLRVLIVGQIPPPTHGQALMILALLQAEMPGVERFHVRLAYSDDIHEVGRFRPRKLLRLFTTVARILVAIARYRPHVVCYPPSGPTWVGVLRDMITLICIRPFCRALVFHFHASGLSELWPNRIPRSLRGPFRRAFFAADAAVMVSEATPPDGQVLQARRTFYVPYGVSDVAGSRAARAKDVPRILFVGALLESKGPLVLTEACLMLWRKGLTFELHLMGGAREGIDQAILRMASPFERQVRVLGMLTGPEKWRQFEEADVFSLPSYYESEALPVVCLEAMMWSLPIVATDWRGIQDVVIDGETGFLVPPKDPQALADRLELLLEDADLRHKLGAGGRQRYQDEYTIERYRMRMREVFFEVAGLGGTLKGPSKSATGRR